MVAKLEEYEWYEFDPRALMRYLLTGFIWRGGVIVSLFYKRYHEW